MSQAKLNANKSCAIAKGLGPPVLFQGIKYSTAPIRHLGIHVDSTGICTEFMEDMIATKISSKLAQWSMVKPTIHGKCLLINTFLTSKIWYFTHAFPASDKFLDRISIILKSWIWPNTKAPILLSKLFGPKSTGGLGLLDFKYHSCCLFSKWIFEILNFTSYDLSWQCAARINFCKAIKVNNTSYPTSLQKYLYEHPNARGPQTLSVFGGMFLRLSEIGLEDHCK